MSINLNLAGVALVVSMLAPTAFANTYVKCGESVDPDTLETTGYELELSSEHSDGYNGPVGDSWSLKLQKEDSDWIVSNDITAETSMVGLDTVIDIKIVMGNSPSGAVGVRYKLIGLYSDFPVLEKYSIGGFVGNLKVGEFQCVSGND